MHGARTVAAVQITLSGTVVVVGGLVVLALVLMVAAAAISRSGAPKRRPGPYRTGRGSVSPRARNTGDITGQGYSGLGTMPGVAGNLGATNAESLFGQWGGVGEPDPGGGAHGQPGYGFAPGHGGGDHSGDGGHGDGDGDGDGGDGD